MTADYHQHIVVELLRVASAHPDRTALIHLPDGVTEGSRLTFRQLITRICKLAARLQRESLTGQPVLVATATGPDYAVSLFACFFAGAIAVPMPEIWSRRWDAVLQQMRPGAILVSRITEQPAQNAASELLHIAVDQDHLSVADWREPALAAEATAFVQFTSGSTGTPKGVVVSHGALAANRNMIRDGFHNSEPVYTVTWLPPWHDMGLVGALLHPLADGETVVTMPPWIAVQRPIRWLRAIQTYGARVSGGPAFGYLNCVNRITPAEMAGLDLGSWGLAYCGAEPVRDATLRKFAEKFGPTGFGKDVFVPCYGLAEATLFVAGCRHSQPLRTVKVDPQILGNERRAVAIEDGRALVSCGRARAGGHISIIDKQTGASLPEAEVGEIVVTGPHLADGYWGVKDQDNTAFEGEGDARRLLTGDLGFVLDGDLFVTGRIKNVIIVRGMKHHAEDIELVACQAHTALHQGSAAAFSIDNGAVEQIVIVAEIPRSEAVAIDVEAVEAAIRTGILGACGVRPDVVLLVRQGMIPRTTSGKVERGRCRDDYHAGSWPTETLSDSRNSSLQPA